MPETYHLSAPQEFIFKSPNRINLFMAGTGSGKTFLKGVLAARFISKFPKVLGFIAANTYEQLNTSTLKGIRDVWRDYFKMYDDIHYVVGKTPPKHFNTEGHNFDRYDSIISFINGAVIYKASLDNYKAHEGKEFGWAMLDETKDTKEEAVKEVILHRLRQPGIILNGKNINPLYIGTTPAKVDWLNDWFRLDEYEDEIQARIYDKNDYFRYEDGDKCVSVSSTYHNEVNLPEGHIDGLVKEHTDREGKLTQSGSRLIYSNPFVKVGGEFYSSFDRQLHTGDVQFLEGEPIHISYDFNVVPYMTLLCFQIIKKGDLYISRQFDEFCLPSPDNTTERITREFLRKYGTRINGLFFYGDPTGTARDTRSRKNDYDIIREVLRPYINNYSDRVRYKAPPVIKRRDFANNIFDERFDIRILVDKKCKKIIADFEYLKEDADGKKLKEKVKDPDTGQSYEKYGHCVAKGTRVMTMQGERNIEDIAVGDMVLTRKGYRKVLWSGISGRNKKVNTYKIGNSVLTCTPEHKIYTPSGFKQSIDLIGWNIICIFDSKKRCEKQKYSTVRSSTGIQKRKQCQTEDISGDGLTEGNCTCIDTNGNSTTERSPKVTMSTIKTMISAITKLRILSWCLILNTYQTITKASQTNSSKRSFSYSLRKLFQRQKNGIVQKQEESGTGNMLNSPFLKEIARSFVKNVVQASQLEYQRRLNFVLGDASQDTTCESIGHSVSGTKNEPVRCAEKSFQFTSGAKHKLVVRNVELLSERCEPAVYNLHIEDQHEYFANGILIKNCSDSFDYFITEAFNKYFNM